MANKNDVGKIDWLDISVEDAPALRDFYIIVEDHESSAALYQEP